MFDSDLKKYQLEGNIKNRIRGDVDYYFETFNKKVNEILDKHAPFKKLSIQDEKLSQKNLGSLLEYLTKNKNRLCSRKVIRVKRKKDPERENKKPLQQIQTLSKQIG